MMIYYLLLWFCILFCFCVMVFLNCINLHRKPWPGVNDQGIIRVVDFFAMEPENLSVYWGQIGENNSRATSVIAPVLALYNYNNTILIDGRFVRSHRAAVKTLLHEICHYNQHVQGRIFLDESKNYLTKPIEREANAFASAWFKIALKVYHDKI